MTILEAIKHHLFTIRREALLAKKEEEMAGNVVKESFEDGRLHAVTDLSLFISWEEEGKETE